MKNIAQPMTVKLSALTHFALDAAKKCSWVARRYGDHVESAETDTGNQVSHLSNEPFVSITSTRRDLHKSQYRKR